MKAVLLTVSGRIPKEIEAEAAAGKRPRPDYLAMAAAFGAELLDYDAARRVGGRAGRLVERLAGPDALLAWVCFARRMEFRLVFTDGEQVGIPFAFLLKYFATRRPAHAMIAHLFSAPKKVRLVSLFQLYHAIDRFFCYSTWQQRFIRARWGLPDEQVSFIPFMVDAAFFDPVNANGSVPVGDLPLPGRPLICSAGLEFRDYPTFISAVDSVDVNVVIAAASPWSKRPDSTAGRRLPANVIVQGFSQHDLRSLYAASSFVVMPLYPVDFQAGVTAILEAMAMGKAVICTRTPGQSDILVEGETGLYVPPSDPAALRAAVQRLLDHPEEARRLGQNARRAALESFSQGCYVERLNCHVLELLSIHHP